MKVARYILLVVFASLLLAGVLWARSKTDSKLCTKVEVVILNNDSATFVTSDGVLAFINRQNIKLEGVPMGEINTDKVEQALNRSPYLEDVECIKQQNGVLQIQVTQLLPVMRIFDGENSYYVNAMGKKMTASPDFFCDVPIVYGHFTAKYGPEKLLPMVQYVRNDSALSAVVSMYQFKGPNDIYVIPCITGHVVNFGSVDNYENKFKKLLLFYKKVMPQRGWETYDTISVKWDHQVVATLRTRKVHTEVVDTLDAETNEDMSWVNEGIDLVNHSEDSKAASADSKKSEPKKESEPKKTEPKKAEAKKSDTKKSEPKKSEAKKSDTKKSDAKKSDVKKSDAKKSEPKKTKEKKSDSKKESSTKKSSSSSKSDTKKTNKKKK